VLAALAVLTLAVLLGDRDRSGVPANSTGDDRALPANQAPALSEIAEAVEESSRAAEIPSASTAPPIVSEGILRLRFVSVLDASPVPDMPFRVFRERGGNKDLARGISDAHGRAEVAGLEENVILVETNRRPPFASRVAGSWLARNESKELIVRLDGGARVVGRVVDDLGAPVEGAEVLVDSDYAAEPGLHALDRERVSAVTGADGRFAVDHVSSRPKGVWIVDGEERPERWDPAAVRVRKGGAVALKSPDVKPGSR
jgi:hypothetical protein